MGACWGALNIVGCHYLYPGVYGAACGILTWYEGTNRSQRLVVWKMCERLTLFAEFQVTPNETLWTLTSRPKYE
jgi:hypothetical protein